MIAELGLNLLAGFLGSSHCIGMCGGFAISLGLGSQGRTQLLTRQGVYSAGRVFTYSTLGTVAGLAGGRLVSQDSLSRVVNVAAVLSVVCGLFLIVEGLAAFGIRFRRGSTVPRGPCLSGALLRPFLRGRGLHHAFLCGVLTGFLPCGLVYGFLALAASKADPLQGAAVMMAFGLGTIPLMILTGFSSSLISLATRQRLLRVAAICVVGTGALTVFRGASMFTGKGRPVPVCPFCAAKAKTDA